ncbi:MAG: hypothetical protein JWL76_1095 [Thermoleophilia bacterium]|nr:hypothetical protein [Thermoleophilia bacterium]
MRNDLLGNVAETARHPRFDTPAARTARDGTCAATGRWTNVQVGTKQIALGLGLGVAAAGGVAAWLLARDGDDAGAAPHDHATHDHGTGDHGADASTLPLPAPAQGGGYVDAKDAPNGAGSGIPANADGPGNLAVAWWPQDISLTQQGDDATLRFQSTIVNLGGEAVPVAPGDRVEYTVSRSDTKGGIGEVVGHGSAPLDRADVKTFPVEVGVDIGIPISDLGARLQTISSLAPQTAAIVGAGHASQAITIHDAKAGHYTLSQHVVRADGSSDVSAFDDERLTEFRLDGTGNILHLGSRYAT